MKNCRFTSIGSILVMIAVLMLNATTSSAQEVATFMGSVNTLWSNPDNWADGHKPTTEDLSVNIAADVVVDEDATIQNLYDASTCNLTLQEGRILTVKEAIVWNKGGDFTLEDGTKKTCKMMSQYEAENLPYAEADTYRAAALPYATGRYSMTVLLPKAGTTVADILGGLTAQKMRDLSATMEAGKRLLLFEMPKFETRVNINLVETLNEMGLPSWFSDCNIRGMVQDPDGTPHGVFVSNMFQVARVNVSEEGTEAAAVTVVETYDGMSPGEPVVFRADHPFVYFISEKDTGAVLFVGTFEGDDAEAGDIETGIRDLKL